MLWLQREVSKETKEKYPEGETHVKDEERPAVDAQTLLSLKRSLSF